MRKSAIVIGFGAFFVTMALLLKFYAYDRLAVIPLDQNTRAVAYDPHARFFDATTLSFKTGPLTTTIGAVADKKASEAYGHNVVIFSKWQFTENDTKPPPMEAFTETIAVDRHTGLPVHCCDEMLNDVPTRHEGYTVKFPFDSRKTTYQYWDYWAGKSMSMTYVDTEQISGLTVYKYTGSVARTPYATAPKKDLPGFLFGGAKDSPKVTANRMYAGQRTIWVEPTTGAFIKVQEHNLQTFIDPKNGKQITGVNTLQTFTPATVAQNVHDYKSKAAQLKMLSLAPWILGVLGVLLLIGGVLMTLLLGRGGGDGRDDRGDGGYGGDDDDYDYDERERDTTRVGVTGLFDGPDEDRTQG